MAVAVYALCALTSIGCAVLLFRAYAASRFALLFWSAICFAGLAVNNIILFIDLVVVPGVDMSLWRKAPAVAGLLALLHGLISDSK